MPKICSEGECGNPHRARGLCSTHYNQLHTNRHVRHLITCVVCGSEHWSARRDGKFCSDDCRAVDYKTRDYSDRAYRYAPPSRRARARAHLRRAAKGTRGRRWVTGHCHRCGASFTAPCMGNDIARYCSDRCASLSRNARRRARKRSAEVIPYSRQQIFHRDNWRCHICGTGVDRQVKVPHPQAPTIDHVLPLVHGGADTPANVATAHFLCNSTKGAGGGGQLALIG